MAALPHLARKRTSVESIRQRRRGGTQSEGGMQAFRPLSSSSASAYSKLDEQLASSSAGRFALHSDFSAHSRKQYLCPSVCATQVAPSGQSAALTQSAIEQ